MEALRKANNCLEARILPKSLKTDTSRGEKVPAEGGSRSVSIWGLPLAKKQRVSKLENESLSI